MRYLQVTRFVMRNVNNFLGLPLHDVPRRDQPVRGLALARCQLRTAPP